jgi:hypothetical protein
MSSEVRQIGSVTFQSSLERGIGIKVWRGQWQGSEWDAYRVWGWCTVVVAREQWTVKTRVEPAILCCNAMQPAVWHLTEAHGDEGGSGPWEIKLEQVAEEDQ